MTELANCLDKKRSLARHICNLPVSIKITLTVNIKVTVTVVFTFYFLKYSVNKFSKEFIHVKHLIRVFIAG